MRRTINKNEKGITLIALVITIIVLLILAGVAISMLSGENGILKQAGKAKTNSDLSQISESIKLSAMEGIADTDHKLTEEEFKTALKEKHGYEVGEDGTITYVDEKYVPTDRGVIKATLKDMKKEGGATYVNTTIEDNSGNKIVIPMNFKISSESPTEVTEGMIIEDNEGNQYVWIPVFEKDEDHTWGADFSEVESGEDWEAIKTALIKYTNPSIDEGTYTYGKDGWEDAWYGYDSYGYYDGEKFNCYTNGNMTEPEYNKLYQDMLKSVYKNKGFYIGRYEMGIAVVNSTTEAERITRTSMNEYNGFNPRGPNTILVENGAPSIKGMTVPISKPNAVGYTYITQPQAQMLAKKLGTKSSYSNVESSILFLLQRDIVCVFLENYGKIDSDALEGAGDEITSSHLNNNELSRLLGNYLNSSFKMDQGFYNLPISSTELGSWENKSENAKDTSTTWLCTTGASKQNSCLNIYDFGGNLHEWTLGRGKNVTTCSVPCGGAGFNDSTYISSKVIGNPQTANISCSSRVALFVK